MGIEKELTKNVHHKDIRGKAANFAVPEETLCDSAVGWELEVLCPTKKKTRKR